MPVFGSGACQKELKFKNLNNNPGHVQKASIITSNWTPAVSQSVKANGEIFDSILSLFSIT